MEEGQDKCGTCRFLKEYSSRTGLCHRYPPTPQGSNDNGHWPRVNLDDWCGEYKAKEQ